MLRARPPARRIGNADIKLLRVFVAVTQAGGFTAAQARLNVSQPTISAQMASLEDRLGVRLCTRGRRQFSLTAEGERVYDAAMVLLRSLDTFNLSIGEVTGELLGELRIGVADACLSNEEMNLQGLISQLKARAPMAHVNLQVGAVTDLEQGLINQTVDLAIGPLRQRRPELEYAEITRERHQIYCAPPHPFFDRDDGDISVSDLEQAEFIQRSYLTDWESPVDVSFNYTSSVVHMEAAAILIRSGVYIGYLPVHFARQMVERGLMRPLLVDQAGYDSVFVIATRRSDQSRLVSLFIKLLGEQTNRALGPVGRA